MEHQPSQSGVHDSRAQQLHTYIHDFTLDASQVSQAGTVPSGVFCLFFTNSRILFFLRNASISVNAETTGEHTVKFEDKALIEGIVQMLKGNSSKPV